MFNGSRALWRWCFALLVLPTGVLALDHDKIESCDDWNCRIEKALQKLSDQITRLTNFLIPDQPEENEPPSTDPSGHWPTTTLYASNVVTYTVTTTGGYPSATPEDPSDTGVLKPSYTYTPDPSSNPEKELRPHPGYRSVAYFGNWDIYSRKFFPQMIPVDRITHLLYSFANIDNKTGEVTLVDEFADSKALFEGDTKSEYNDLYGNLKQLNLLKRKWRNFKVLLSIGGWMYTNEQSNLEVPAASDEDRQNFADSCAQLIVDYGFDGIDIDWEYPSTPEKGDQLLDLLVKTRAAMDDVAAGLAQGEGYGSEPEFILSIAAPAAEANYKNFPLKDISDVVDFINLMAYDYSGAWSENSGHLSNLYPSEKCPTCATLNTEEVVKAYIDLGVPSRKINLGMPLYGRSFLHTNGLGQSFDGVGEGSYENSHGVWDVKDLPAGDAKEYIDMEAGATYSYDNNSQILVSYDTPEMAAMKVGWLKKQKLGGAMFWEVSQDRKGNDSILIKSVKQLGGYRGRQIEVKHNWIHYPDSQFDNLSNEFEEAGGEDGEGDYGEEPRHEGDKYHGGDEDDE